MSTRVIVCKLGRLGELRKVLDKNTPNPINLLRDNNSQTEANESEQRRKRLKSSIFHDEFKSEKLYSNHSSNKPSRNSILEALLSSENEPTLDKEDEDITEVQVLNANGGLLLSDRIKQAVMSLKLGQAVSKLGIKLPP